VPDIEMPPRISEEEEEEEEEEERGGVIDSEQIENKMNRGRERERERERDRGTQSKNKSPRRAASTRANVKKLKPF